MKHYKVYGIHIVSDFEFLQLNSASEVVEKDSVWIQEGSLPEQYKLEKDCYSKIERDISYLSNRTCYMLIENGKKITYEKKKDASDANLNAYLLGWGIAMICYQRGEMAIHCSCVAKDNQAIMISGTSGMGKSSVTSLLLKSGYSLVADDMTVIKMQEDGIVYATPAFPYQKLCRDAAFLSGCKEEEMIYIDEKKDKFFVPFKEEFSEKPVPLKAMILLGVSKAGKVEKGEIEGVEKIHACMQAMFLKGLLKEKMKTPYIVNQCLTLASKIPMYYVLRPLGMDTREEVFQNITKLI